MNIREQLKALEKKGLRFKEMGCGRDSNEPMSADEMELAIEIFTDIEKIVNQLEYEGARQERLEKIREVVSGIVTDLGELK